MYIHGVLFLRTIYFRELILKEVIQFSTFSNTVLTDETGVKGIFFLWIVTI